MSLAAGPMLCWLGNAAMYSLDSAKLQITALPGSHSGECIADFSTRPVLHA